MIEGSAKTLAPPIHPTQPCQGCFDLDQPLATRSPGQPHSPAAPWIRSFLFALLVYALLRAWILATSFEAVSVPVYEIPVIGNYGWALASDVSLLPWAAHYDNAGAQILTAWLSALSHKLFGTSYLALKLVPMAFGVILLAMVGRMLARQFSGRAALIGMLSVAIAPPIVTKYSMLAKGNHFEGLTLLFVALLAALETPEPGAPRRRLWVAFTGGALGFAIAMYFGAMLTGVVLAVAWWMRFGLRQSARDLPALGGGLAVGLAPLLAINMSSGGRAKQFGTELGSADAGLNVSELLSKGHRLLTEELPIGACFEDPWGVSPRIPESVFLIATLLSWFFVAGAWLRTFKPADALETPPSIGERRTRRAALWILWAYPVGVLLVLVLKSLPVTAKGPPASVLGVRYLLGYFFFSLLLIAVAVDALLASRTRMPRIVGWALGLGLVFTWPFTAAIASGNFEDRSLATAHPAVHLRQYPLVFHRDLHLGEDAPVDTTRMKACLENLSRAGRPDQRSELALGLGYFLAMAQLGYQGPNGDQALSLDAVTLDFDPEDHPDLLRGVGMCFHDAARNRRLHTKGTMATPMRQRIDLILEDTESAPWIAEGFGMSQQYPLVRRLAVNVTRSLMLMGVLPKELRHSTLNGVAHTLREHLDLGSEAAERRVEKQLRRFKPEEQASIRGFMGLAGDLR